MPSFTPREMFAIYALSLNLFFVPTHFAFHRWGLPGFLSKYFNLKLSPRDRKIALVLELASWNLMFLVSLLHFPTGPLQFQTGHILIQIATTLNLVLFGVLFYLLAVLAAGRLWMIMSSRETFPEPTSKKRAIAKWACTFTLSIGLFLVTNNVLVPLAKAHDLTWNLWRR